MAHDHEQAKQQLKDALQEVKWAKDSGDPMKFAVAMRKARLLTNKIMPEMERDVRDRGQQPDPEVGRILSEFMQLTEYFDVILGKHSGH
jgi:hypothetical protein